MKKISILCITIICLLFLVGCSQMQTMNIEAQVLSINENILEGRLIGMLLGSSSGGFSSDKIKVGVSFEINETLFLEDLDLNHAQLAYYKDRNTLPLSLEVHDFDAMIGRGILDIRLNGVKVGERYLNKSLSNKFVDYMKNNK